MHVVLGPRKKPQVSKHTSEWGSEFCNARWGCKQHIEWLFRLRIHCKTTERATNPQGVETESESNIEEEDGKKPSELVVVAWLHMLDHAAMFRLGEPICKFDLFAYVCTYYNVVKVINSKY